MDLWIIRALLFAAILVGGYFIRPFGHNLPLTFTFSAALGLVILLIEIRIRKFSIKTLLGAALGSILGIIGASLISMIIARMSFMTSADRDICAAADTDRHDVRGAGCRRA